MDAVVLALCSAFLFGLMTVLLRPALARGADPLVGALFTLLPALAVAATAAIVVGEWELTGLWPFLLAGLLGPGISQVLFTFAIREAGPSRTSATVGMAPLFAVFFAVVLLDEPLVAGLVLGALLIVGGGVMLALESERPAHVRRIGLVLAGCAALAFAMRDTFVRSVAVDTSVSPELAIAATLFSGGCLMLVALVVTHRKLVLREAPVFLPAGIAFGVSYVMLYEAFYRGRLSVVAPLVATESLWGLALSAIFLSRHERVGAKLALGGALIVAGGVLIGLSR